MKIVYILNATTLLGGATKSFLYLIDILRKKGFEPLVICPDKEGVYLYLQSQGVACKSIRYREAWLPKCKSKTGTVINCLRYVKISLINFIGVLKLCFICKRFRADLIHTNTSVNDIGYFTGKICRIPHVWHIREYGDLDFDNTIPFLERRLHSVNSNSIAITTDIARHRKILRHPNNRVIYNGIISTSFVPAVTLDKEPFFLFAGRCTDGKGFNDLINAYIKYCKCTANPLAFKVTGHIYDTQDAIQQWELLKVHHLEDKVEWIGMREDIEIFMSKATAVIIPSRCEGFGRVMPESMYNGCLAIGRNIGGTKEQFDIGRETVKDEIGLRYNTEDELINHMKNITENGLSQYLPMMKRAQEAVLHLYASETYADNVISFYNEILKHNKND